MSNSPEVADIVREVIARGGLSASKEQWKVLNAITACRTEQLGGHLYRCLDCGKERSAYNSCRNRHCPKCQGEDTAKWLTERSKELLPVPYFHVVFTIPHELNGIALQNKKLVYDILFQAASRTLQDVARSKLGGSIGYLGVLHTWGQKLEAHPHIHFVVPGVVIKYNSTVKKTSDSFFLPQKALKIVFRAKFLELLQKAYPKLEFHGEPKELQNKQSFESLLRALTKKHWICYLKRPFAGSSAVLKYLASYTHKVAISNSRIKEHKNRKVSFTYKDYADNCSRKTCTLTDKEFVRRFLLHVLPKNFTRIRNFGFLANGVRKKKLNLLRYALGENRKELQPPSQHRACSSCGSFHFELVREIKPSKTYLPQCRSHTNGELPLVA